MERVVIIDFGSQVTQLIARKVRECGTYCEIYPYNNIPELSEHCRGVILSGSPFSVREENAPVIDQNRFLNKYPVMGICYGAQSLAHHNGGTVERSDSREYGKATLKKTQEDQIFSGVDTDSQIWMSHGDTITALPEDADIIANSDSIDVAAFKLKGYDYPVYGLQFHPEVYHSLQGKDMIDNFLDICGLAKDWTPASFVDGTVAELKDKLGDDKVILGLSGGVDSTVAAGLLHRAIGENLHCIFIDNGLLRKDEFDQVLESYNGLGLNVKGVNAKALFYEALSGIEDPEQKRKAIGRVFVEVFEQESKLVENAQWLAQGTIYPDVIESVSVHGPSAKIKSHHNVGGLPEKMDLKVVEPLRKLFKDEVRRVGRELELPADILNRHPFPGPGLAIRILGDITEDKVNLLQAADAIFINKLKEENHYDKVWQAGVILLPVQSVGVMGDERTYEQVVALRAVNSTDGMTAEWSKLPFDFLAEVSTQIINNVKGINRVVYDISTKPPATIEWE